MGGRAAADERRRIADDVHDSVGHTLSCDHVAPDLGSLRGAFRPGCSERAPPDEAEQGGRETLEDLRGVVGLPRSDDSAKDAGWT